MESMLGFRHDDVVCACAEFVRCRSLWGTAEENTFKFCISISQNRSLDQLILPSHDLVTPRFVPCECVHLRPPSSGDVSSSAVAIVAGFRLSYHMLTAGPSQHFSPPLRTLSSPPTPPPSLHRPSPHNPTSSTLAPFINQHMAL